MLKELEERDYKKINDFENVELKEHLNFFLKFRMKPKNTEWYAKLLQQTIAYRTTEGEIFQNNVSLVCFFLVDSTDKDYWDYFSTLYNPFDLRTEDDFEALERLFKIFRDDVDYVVGTGDIVA